MKTSDFIKIQCMKNNISVDQLATKLGQSPKKFLKKLEREGLSDQEIRQIAEIFGAEYIQSFNYSDSSLDSDEDIYNEMLVSKYINDKLGIKVQLADGAIIDSQYKKLDDSTFSRINNLFRNVPHYALMLNANQMTADAYTVIYDKSIGTLQQSASNRDRFRANIVEFGTNNKVRGQAELEKFELKLMTPAIAMLDIASIVTSQYYLASINRKLTSIDKKIDSIQRFLEESKRSSMWADGQFIKDVSNKIYDISQNEYYRIATLTSIQMIRRNALSNVKFYHEQLTKFVSESLNTDEKSHVETRNRLDQFYDHFEELSYAIYTYGFAYIVEVYLAQISDVSFLVNVREELSSIIEDYQKDYSQSLKDYMNNVKSVNTDALTDYFAKDVPVLSFIPYSGPGSNIFSFVKTASSFAYIAATIDKAVKEKNKGDINIQVNDIVDHIKKSGEIIESTVQAISQLEDFYSKSMELLITSDSAYVRIEESTEVENVGIKAEA